jgi:hypothetical protein
MQFFVVIVRSEILLGTIFSHPKCKPVSLLIQRHEIINVSLMRWTDYAAIHFCLVAYVSFRRQECAKSCVAGT